MRLSVVLLWVLILHAAPSLIRNEENGRQAMRKLEGEGLKPKFHQLDIDSAESIENLIKHITETYGGLDVLINNAAMAYKMTSTAPFIEQATNTIRTNFTGTLNVTRALLPLIRAHGRIVNVSSMASRLSQVSVDLQHKFSDPALIESELVALMQQFVDDVAAGGHQAKGWSNNAYATSKVGVTALTKVSSPSVHTSQNKCTHDVIVYVKCIRTFMLG